MSRPGVVYIGEDVELGDFAMWSGRWSAHWESVDGSTLRQGPTGVSAADAIAWGRTQADVVLVRPGDSTTQYSAGALKVSEHVWPDGQELEARRDARKAYLDRPADAPPILWRVKHCLSPEITRLPGFTECYERALQRDGRVHGVIEPLGVEGVGRFSGVIRVAARTVDDARQKALAATRDAQHEALATCRLTADGIGWMGSVSDPEPWDPALV